MKGTRVPIILAILLWSAPQAHAQNPSAVPADQRTNAFTAMPRAEAEYRLGPGDLVEISVFGVDEFKHTIRINASGTIKLPLIETVAAEGLTPAELEKRLATLLGHEVINNPQVSVFVREYRSQPVFVLGAVKSPGQYQITLQMRIVDAISMAGGLQPTASDEVVIQRATRDGEEKKITVNIAELLEKGDLQRNVVVRGGDVIHVQERLAETVYVLGEVNRAGAYPKPPKQDLRVSQVMAWAGGPSKTAKLSKGILVRYKENGQREEVPMDLGQILKGKKEDFFVRANDIIFVPGSRFKDLGVTMLNGLGGTLAAIPYRIP